MLVSDGGQLIRVPVGGIRIASRATKGVTIFSTAKDEKVVSVERISEPEDDGEEVGEIVNETPIEPEVGARRAASRGRMNLTRLWFRTGRHVPPGFFMCLRAVGRARSR